MNNADMTFSVVASFEHNGAERRLGFTATADEATNARLFQKLNFTMRQTWLALNGHMGPDAQAEAERLTL